MTMRKVMIYSRFERFWHWTQMALIMALLFTGFGLHGFHGMLSFETAVNVHTWCAIGLILLWVFAIFWHMTTGTWKHYLPTTNGLVRVAMFYAVGIFKGEHHPYKKSFWRKHNPMQALTYLALKLMIFPVIWITGLAYLFYDMWKQIPDAALLFEGVVLLHTFMAFIMVAFIIAHIYLLTTHNTLITNVKTMVDGFDEVDLSEAEASYLAADEPGHIK